MIFTRSVSKTTTASKMELFLALVNGGKPLPNVTKSYINFVEVPDTPHSTLHNIRYIKIYRSVTVK